MIGTKKRKRRKKLSVLLEELQKRMWNSIEQSDDIA